MDVLNPVYKSKLACGRGGVGFMSESSWFFHRKLVVGGRPRLFLHRFESIFLGSHINSGTKNHNSKSKQQ